MSEMNKLIKLLNESVAPIDIQGLDIRELIKFDLYSILKDSKDNELEKWLIDLYLDSIFNVNSTKILNAINSDFFKNYFSSGTYHCFIEDSNGAKVYFLSKRPKFYKVPIEYVFLKLKEIKSGFLEKLKKNYENKEFDVYSFLIPDIKSSILFLNYLCFILGYIFVDVSLIESFKSEQVLRKHIFVSYGILERYLQFRKLDIKYFLQEVFANGKSLYIVFNDNNDLQNFNSVLYNKNNISQKENKSVSSQKLDDIFFGDQL